MKILSICTWSCRTVSISFLAFRTTSWLIRRWGWRCLCWKSAFEIKLTGLKLSDAVLTLKDFGKLDCCRVQLNNSIIPERWKWLQWTCSSRTVGNVISHVVHLNWLRLPGLWATFSWRFKLDNLEKRFPQLSHSWTCSVSQDGFCNKRDYSDSSERVWEMIVDKTGNDVYLVRF